MFIYLERVQNYYILKRKNSNLEKFSSQCSDFIFLCVCVRIYTVCIQIFNNVT